MYFHWLYQVVLLLQLSGESQYQTLYVLFYSFGFELALSDGHVGDVLGAPTIGMRVYCDNFWQKRTRPLLLIGFFD